jgi:glycosyltransferase involved in cell wall biosynthesis
MVRIAVDLQPLQSSSSRGRGIGRYVQEVLERLLTKPTTVEYRLYAHPGLPEPELRIPEGMRIHALPFGESRPVNDTAYIAMLLAERVDAVFLTSPLELTEPIVPDFASFPGALYTIAYDLIPFIFAQHYLRDNDSRNLYARRLRNLRHSDRVFAISEATRRDTVRLLEVPPEKTVNVSGGVSSFFMPIPEKERAPWRKTFAQRFGIVRPFVLYTGGEDWRKNLDGLVEAYALLPAALRREHQLVVANIVMLPRRLSKPAPPRKASQATKSSSLILSRIKNCGRCIRCAASLSFPPITKGLVCPS